MTWKIYLAVGVVLLSLFLILSNGLKFGIDFSGGTVFIIGLEEPLPKDKMAGAVNTVVQRLDWTGLKNVKAYGLGGKFILVQMPETDPEKVEEIKELIRKQGKFEATIDGNLLFTGEEVTVVRDPQRGYGVHRVGDKWEWRLPFVLTDEAAVRFTRLTFHQCQREFDPQYGLRMKCKATFFFIDRPVGATVLIPKDVFQEEEEVIRMMEGVDVNEIFLNAGVKYYVVDENFDFNGLSHPVIAPDLPETENWPVDKRVKKTEDYWIYSLVNLKAVIRLSEDVANMSARSLDEAHIMKNLVIFGRTDTKEAAEKRLGEIEAILYSGSLPVGVESIDTRSIPPTEGQRTFQGLMLAMGLAMIAVSSYIGYRYREPKITLAIIWTMLSELVITLGFAAAIGWRLDVASIVGLIAGIGTGVNDQIVITDEVMRGEKEEEEKKKLSLRERISRAFFVVISGAAATLATTVPLMYFGAQGLSALMGYAITTTVDVLAGVLITRPAYGDLISILLGKEKPNP